MHKQLNPELAAAAAAAAAGHVTSLASGHMTAGHMTGLAAAPQPLKFPPALMSSAAAAGAPLFDSLAAVQHKPLTTKLKGGTQVAATAANSHMFATAGGAQKKANGSASSAVTGNGSKFAPY